MMEFLAALFFYGTSLSAKLHTVEIAGIGLASLLFAPPPLPKLAASAENPALRHQIGLKFFAALIVRYMASVAFMFLFYGGFIALWGGSRWGVAGLLFVIAAAVVWGTLRIERALLLNKPHLVNGPSEK